MCEWRKLQSSHLQFAKLVHSTNVTSMVRSSKGDGKEKSLSDCNETLSCYKSDFNLCKEDCLIMICDKMHMLE